MKQLKTASRNSPWGRACCQKAVCILDFFFFFFFGGGGGVGGFYSSSKNMSNSYL